MSSTAEEIMKEAAKEEAEYARSVNSVDELGFPLVPDVVDRCQWCNQTETGSSY